MYAEGEGVEQDYKEAVSWYRKAAEQGDSAGQVGLGYMYAEGEGVEQDYKEAVSWYRKAAEQGDADAQYNLGYMYAEGEGVEQDYKEAVCWYRKAAEQGDALGQNKLGFMYYGGLGVPQDYNEAVKWFRKAADQGLAEARKSLELIPNEDKRIVEDETETIQPSQPEKSSLPSMAGKSYEKYLTQNLSNYRAFAYNSFTGRSGRAWASQSPKQAIDTAMSYCEKKSYEKCSLFALGDFIVDGMEPEEIMEIAEKYYTETLPDLAKVSDGELKGERLSSSEISQYLGDRKLSGRNYNRISHKVIWDSNGTMRGEADTVNNIERRKTSIGKWSVQDGKLCRQWDNWMGGRHECLLVYKDGNILRGYDSHGDDIETLFLPETPLVFNGVANPTNNNPVEELAATSEMLVLSAEKIVQAWSVLLNQDYSLIEGDGGSWGVYRSVFLPPLKYDVKRTDSLVSPYKLIITGKAKWDSNFESLDADVYSEVFETNFGFSSREKALASTKESDFSRGKGRKYNLIIQYSFRNGSWVINEVSDDLHGFLGENSSSGIKKGAARLESFVVE